MPHMKMPIWTFQRHLAGLSLYSAPPRAEIAVAKSSHPLSVSFSTGGMSAYGMVRPCSCPASVLSGQGAPTTRSAPCLRYPRLSESISARTHSMLSATMSVVRSCCDRSGHAVSWKHGLPTCRRGLTPSRYQSGEINRTGAISRCGDDMMRVMLYEAAHAGAYYQVVMAQGLGHEDRQAPWDEEGDRGAGASVGGDHAPHLG